MKMRNEIQLTDTQIENAYGINITACQQEAPDV